jgi:hypothetical protein
MVETDGVNFQTGDVFNEGDYREEGGNWIADVIFDLIPDLQKAFREEIKSNFAKRFRPS